MPSSGAALRRLVARVVNALRPSRADRELEREVTSHLALLEDEYRRRGLAPEAAKRAARLALGGIEQTKQLHRDARSLRWLDAARRDIVYAGRTLRRRPVLAATAVLSIAVGIGLNAAVFSIVDWVLLRPLPYPAPHELVRISTAGTRPLTTPEPVTPAEFAVFAGSPAFRQATAFSTATRVLGGSGVEPVHVVVARVMGDPFGTFGITPAAGRPLTTAEISSGAPVIVISHDVWQRATGGDPDIAGRTLMIDGAPYAVAGVMPPGRGYPADADLWRPITAEERDDGDRELTMVARLQAGVSASQASAALATLADNATKGSATAWAEDIQTNGVRDVQTALSVLFAAAVLVLIVVCANVAALLGGSSGDRVAEMALRRALGATRARLAGQLLIENLVLAVAGGGLGLLLGRWTLNAIVAIAPAGLPRLSEIALDRRIIVVGLVAIVVVGVAAGLGPALQASRRADLIHEGARATRRVRGRRMLVLAQVAVAVVLTAGAGLLARSLQHLVRLENGFAADGLVAVQLYLRGSDGDRSNRLFRDLIEQAEQVPGVRAAAAAMRLPTQLTGLRLPITLQSGTGGEVAVTLRPIGPRYFDVTGIPILAGRAFATTDTRLAPRVAIVNTAFVRDILRGREAIGVRMTTQITGKAPVEIVGVSADITPAGEPDRPALYVTLEQVEVGSSHLLVRTDGDPGAVIPALVKRLRAIAPWLPLDRVQDVAASLELGRAAAKFNTELAGTFALFALLLSAIGVYGLAAGDVASRWRELAVRLALGSSQRGALWTVLRPSVIVMAAGAILGVAGALAAGPALSSLLRGVRAGDPATIAAAPLLLVAVGVTAAFLAAARVFRVDPARTLREG